MADLTTKAIIHYPDGSIAQYKGKRAASMLAQDFEFMGKVLTGTLEECYHFNYLKIKGVKRANVKKIIVDYIFYGYTHKDGEHTIIEYTSDTISKAKKIGEYIWQK